MGHKERDWDALARAVRERRNRIGLTQGAMLKQGGPSRETVRQVEIGERDTYRPTTFLQLDRALAWDPGTADGILDGTVSVEDAVARPARVQASARGTLTATSSMTADATTETPPPDDTQQDPSADLVSRLTEVVRELTQLREPTPRQTEARHYASLALRALLVDVGALDEGQLLPADTGRPPGAEPMTPRLPTPQVKAKYIRMTPKNRTANGTAKRGAFQVRSSRENRDSRT